tara:strand:- start:1703 stop:1855 length:153 start_codon:yes stop_codon:yes gene_type:complete
MAKSKKTKTDYIDELNVIVFQLAQKLTVKEIRQLIAKYQDLAVALSSIKS